MWGDISINGSQSYKEGRGPQTTVDQVNDWAQHIFLKSEEDITVYKSLGNAAQDLFAASALLDLAHANGFAQAVEF